MDLKVSSKSWACYFWENVQRIENMLRDSAFRCVLRMSLFTEIGMEMTPRDVERQLRLLKCRPVRKMESMPEVNVARATDIERDGGSVWASLFGPAIEVSTESRLWLSLLGGPICESGCFEVVVSHWQSVKQFVPSTQALDSSAVRRINFFVGIHFCLRVFL